MDWFWKFLVISVLSKPVIYCSHFHPSQLICLTVRINISANEIRLDQLMASRRVQNCEFSTASQVLLLLAWTKPTPYQTAGRNLENKRLLLTRDYQQHKCLLFGLHYYLFPFFSSIDKVKLSETAPKPSYTGELNTIKNLHIHLLADYSYSASPLNTSTPSHWMAQLPLPILKLPNFFQLEFSTYTIEHVFQFRPSKI